MMGHVALGYEALAESARNLERQSALADRAESCDRQLSRQEVTGAQSNDGTD
jgi:hypothetical protein